MGGKRVLFLGFGFHPSSVERLALSETLRLDQDIKATCKGLDSTRSRRRCALYEVGDWAQPEQGQRCNKVP